MLLLLGIKSVSVVEPAPVRSMAVSPSAGGFVSSVTVRATPSVCTMRTGSLATGTPPLSTPAAETALQLLPVLQLPLVTPFFQNLVAWATVAGASTSTATKAIRRRPEPYEKARSMINPLSLLDG